MKSFASKMGIPREFKRNVEVDFPLAPIVMVKPSLVVIVMDVSVLLTLTQPPSGIPATVTTPVRIFSIPAVSFGICESGNVVVVVEVEVVVDVVVFGVLAMTTGTVVVVVGTVVTGTVVVVVVVVGMVASMTMDKTELRAELFPAISVMNAVTDHLPSARVNTSHAVAVAAS